VSVFDFARVSVGKTAVASSRESRHLPTCLKLAVNRLHAASRFNEFLHFFRACVY